MFLPRKTYIIGVNNNETMRQCNNKTMMNKGLTLIEMIAAVGIFAITVGTISGLFISAVRAQRKSLATQELLDRTSYVIEYMGRTIRMAQKDIDGTCIIAKTNYENPGGDVSKIKFINYEGVCQDFFLDNNQIKEYKTGYATSLPLTPPELKINSLKFYLSGQSQNDVLQPRVTIFLEIESGRIPQSPPKIQVQTSVSQRALDVEY